MTHAITKRVYYADTDAYGVVWHGAYLRWLEEGRVELCSLLGIDTKDLEAKGIVLPVVELNVRYKSSAKINDSVIIETTIKEARTTSIVFEQKVLNKDSLTVNIMAEVKCVALDENKKLIKRLPDFLLNALKKEVEV